MKTTCKHYNVLALENPIHILSYHVVDCVTNIIKIPLLLPDSIDYIDIALVGVS